MNHIIKSLVLSLLVGSTLLLHTSAHADDGATLFAAKGCIGCHGPDGNTPLTPNYPKVAGQNYTYIVNQLNDFKSAKRTNGMAAVMLGMAVALTDDDIDKLAKFLSGTTGAQQ